MPFEETHVMEERTRFIEEAHRSLRSFAACQRRLKMSQLWRLKMSHFGGR